MREHMVLAFAAAGVSAEDLELILNSQEARGWAHRETIPFEGQLLLHFTRKRGPGHLDEITWPAGEEQQ